MVAPLVIPLIALAAGAAGGGLGAAGLYKGKPSARPRYLGGQMEPYEAQQRELLAQYRNQASGLGPSYADIMLEKAGEDARQRASSQSASARGGNIALAQRSASNEQAAATLPLYREAAAQRINEINQARQGVGAISGQLQSQAYAQALNRQAMNTAWDEREAARKQRNKQAVMAAATLGLSTMGQGLMQTQAGGNAAGQAGSDYSAARMAGGGNQAYYGGSTGNSMPATVYLGQQSPSYEDIELRRYQTGPYSR